MAPWCRKETRSRGFELCGSRPSESWSRLKARKSKSISNIKRAFRSPPASRSTHAGRFRRRFMRKWKKLTAGLLFCAAASVYPVGTLFAADANSGKTEDQLLEETAGPVAQADAKPGTGAKAAEGT